MQHIPPGVVTSREDSPGGVTYKFRHFTLGTLGCLRILKLGDQMQISIDIPPGEVSDPEWVKRFEMLSQIVDVCLELIPGKKQPLLQLEEVREKVRLYSAFLKVENSVKMKQFAQSLSHEEGSLLLSCVEHGFLANKSDFVYDLRQRLADFQKFRE